MARAAARSGRDDDAERRRAADERRATGARRGLDRLWAPWRMAYIRKARASRRGCLFCRVGRARADRRDLVLARSAARAADAQSLSLQPART